MKIKNIEKKLKETKDKTEVLGGRISPTQMVAFNLIAEALNVTTAELFKATIDECIVSFLKSMLKIDMNKALEVVENRYEKFAKKDKSKKGFVYKDYSILTNAENNIVSASRIKNLPNEIPLFWFFDDIKLDFNKEDEIINKERYIAYKNFLDELQRANDEEYAELHNEHLLQNEAVMLELEKEKKQVETIAKYYEYVHNNEPIPREVENAFNALDSEFVKEQELLQYPFVTDEQGNQKYSDTEILKAINKEFGEKKFKNINDVVEYAEKGIQENEKKKKELEEKLSVIGAKPGQYDQSYFDNIESDPFGITKGFLNVQKLPDEMIVKYWKYYMNDIEYFADKEINIESIKAYTILKNDDIIKSFKG